MKQKNVTIYLILLGLLWTAIYAYVYLKGWEIETGDILQTVMLATSIPTASCLFFLLLSNGVRNFRLDAVGIVSGIILLLVSQIGTWLAYEVKYKYTEMSLGLWIYALGMAVAAWVLLALHDTIKKQKNSEEKDSFRALILRSLMYGTLVSALILFFSFNGSLPLLMHSDLFCKTAEVDMERMMENHGLIFAGASIAIFLISWLWKHTKLIAGLVALIVFPFLFLFSVVKNSVYVAPDEFMYYPSENVDTPDEVEEISVDDHDVVDSDDTVLYREDSYNPDFIGDGIIGTDQSEDQAYGDVDSITYALTYFKDELKIYSDFPSSSCPKLLPYRLPYNWYSSYPGGPAYDGIIRLLWASRKSISFYGMMCLYGRLIREYIPVEVYRSRGYDEMLIELIQAYDDLSTHPNNFNNVYEVMLNTDIYENTSYDEAYQMYYEMMVDYIAEEYFPYFKDVSHSRVVWVYSFWARRHHEGIDKDVYNALVRLREIYNED